MTIITITAMDFSRVTGGVSLVPTPESIDLETSLQVPVRIIKSLQSFTQVVVDPLPDHDILCKFIITDEHWLHDNVLALLR